MKLKKLVLLLFIVALACSPRVNLIIINKQPVIPEQTSIVILNPEDSFSNIQNKIGVLQVKNSSFRTSCSYNNMIKFLKEEAIKSGANIVKIIAGHLHDNFRTCEGLTAELYRVRDFKKYEKQIEWSEKRKLQWNDFKGSPPSNNNVKAAVTHAGFGYHSNRVHIFSKPVIMVTNVFDCNKSWVRSDQKKRPELLEHEQLHFDISEVYARRLRKAFSLAKLNYFNLHKKTTLIFHQVYKEYLVRQQEFEEQTEYSLNIKRQGEWVKQVSEELKALDAFSN